MFVSQSKSSKEELLSMWGTSLSSEEDVWRVFHAYITETSAAEGLKVVKKVRALLCQYEKWKKKTKNVYFQTHRSFYIIFS